MNAWQAVPARRLLGLALAAWITSAAAGLAATPCGSIQRAEIHVGIDTGDLRGSDHRALQAAVDYVAGLGGGTVHVGPGRNAIGSSKPGAGPAVGILSSKHAPGLKSEENRFLNVATEVKVEK